MDSTVSVKFQENAFKVIGLIAGNQACADCPSPTPDWASVNLGVFVCHKCSGVHRGIGLHITRIKSVKLDSWTLKQMFIMSFVNNQEANSYWEARLPSDRARPTQDTSPEALKSFIYDKYVYKKFVDPEKKPPLEYIIANLDLDADKGEHEDKEQFFQRKLAELGEMLRTKSIITSGKQINPFGSLPKNAKERPLKPLPTIAILEKKENQDDNEESNEPKSSKQRPDNTLSKYMSNSVTPTGKESRKDSRKNDSSPFDQLSLFEGLTLKGTQSVTPKKGPGLFHASSASPEKGNPISPTSGPPDSKFGKSQSPEPPRRPSYTKQLLRAVSASDKDSVRVVREENSYRPPQIGADVEMSDMSRKSSRIESKEDLNKNDGPKKILLKRNSIDLAEENSADEESEDFSRTPRTPYSKNFSSKQLKSKKMISGGGSAQTVDEPFFLNVPNVDMAKHGAHLKRPSQEFEIMRLDVQDQRAKHNANNLIRPERGYPKWVVLMGSFILHFGFGYIYSWGSISPYIAYFFKGDYNQAYYLDVASYSSLIFMGLALGYTFPERLVNAFGFKKSSLLCFLGVFIMLTICSLGHAPMMYSSVPTFVTGFFLGLAYNIPFYCSIQYMADSPATLKAGFYLADSLGAFFFAFFSHLILHPNHEMNSSEKSEYYSQEVSDNVPHLVQSLGTILLIIGVIGSLTLKPKFSFVEKDWTVFRERGELLLKTRKSTLTVRRRGHRAQFSDLKHALLSPMSKSLFQIIIFSSMLGSYYLYSYKVIGLQLGQSDWNLSLFGSFGFIAMSLGKIAALAAFRMSTFKLCMRRVMIAQVLFGLLAAAIYDIYWPYFLLIMFAGGFSDALVKEEIISVYSEEIECSITAFMMIGFTISNFMSFTLVRVGEYVVSPRLINIILILPMIRAFIVERKYTGEMRDKTSVADSEVARMLAD